MIRSLPVSLQANADEFVRAAELALIQSPSLQGCSENSILLCIYRSCQIGLKVNTPEGHAYLIPFKGECTLQVGYKGYIELAARSGKFKRAPTGRAVYSGDSFEYWFDYEPHLTHRPSMTTRSNDQITHCYATAVLRDGTRLLEVLDKGEIDKIRNSSAGRNSGPWTQWYDQMGIKSAIKRLLKRVSLTPEIAAAIQFDDVESLEQVKDVDTPQLTGSASLVAKIAAKTAVAAPAQTAPAGAATATVDAQGEIIEPGDDYADEYPGDEEDQ